MSFLLIPLFAFLNRCRGGFLGMGHTQWARLLFWVLPVTAWACLIDWHIALTCGAAAFVGLMWPLGNAKLQEDASLEAFAVGAAVGVARMLLILAPLMYAHPQLVWLVPIGLLQGVAYHVAWEYLDGLDSHISTPAFKLFGIQFQASEFAKAAPGWGEVLTGGVFGFAFALALL